MLSRVLLVDDEPFIRQGLSVLIDWESEGFCIAAQASDGAAALEILKKEQFDLIIADIRMPRMDGITLLEKIRSEGISDARYVILSGYFEYEYAKTAIRNNCADYILKPVQKDELLKLVRSVADECRKSREAAMMDMERDKAVLDKHLTALVCGKYDDVNLDYVRSHMDSDGQVRYINIEIDFEDEGFRQLDDAGRLAAHRSLYNRCMAIMPDYAQHFLFDVVRRENTYGVGMIFCKYMAERKGITETECLNRLFEALKASSDYALLFHIGNLADSIEGISESFYTAAIAKTIQVFRVDSGARRETALPAGLGRQKLDALLHAISINDRQLIESCADEVYKTINAEHADYRIITLDINYFLYQLIMLASEQDDRVNQQEVMDYITSTAFDKLAMRGSVAHFRRFSVEYADYLRQLSQGASKGVPAEIEKEIRENYGENLSLKSLSEKYYINTAYLGQVFKKQFGQSFKEYLNAYRIERAAELLVNTSEKVYIIAETVGYKNIDYFVGKFVEIKGCTPAKYRKMAKNEPKSSIVANI